LTKVDWIEIEKGVYTLKKKLSHPIIKIKENIDIHERCRTCKKYPVECVPPSDIDTYHCQSYVKRFEVRKLNYNPSRRKQNE
jgi:hypothetical protein